MDGGIAIDIIFIRFIRWKMDIIFNIVDIFKFIEDRIFLKWDGISEGLIGVIKRFVNDESDIIILKKIGEEVFKDG